MLTGMQVQKAAERAEADLEWDEEGEIDDDGEAELL